MKTIVLTLMLAVSTFAAENPLTTFNMRNGRFWADLSEAGDYRQAFLMGLMEGWDLRGHTEASVPEDTANAMTRGAQFSTDDWARMISSIYTDRQNLSLPIGWVAMGCLAIQRGQTTRDAVLTALRKRLGVLSEKLSTASGKEDGVPATELDAVRVILPLTRK